LRGAATSTGSLLTVPDAVAVPRFKAVLLDWRGTLAVTMPWHVWIEKALRRTSRRADPSAADVHLVHEAIREAVLRPDLAMAWRRCDRSAAIHHEFHKRLFHVAGLAPKLGDALYAEESDPANNPFAADVAPTLAALHAAGVRTAVISDIHFDLRPTFVAAGLDAYVHSFVLSFEQGTQKPDEKFFRIALAELGVEPHEALMVGDRSGYDGAAVEVGLPTLLLPPLTGVDDERLHLVLAVCGIPQRAAA
jgi:HAD superfamily hydrolase (TIGR01509 family)